jgi:hypothetical protein
LSGQRKTGYVGAIVMLLTSAKEIALQDKIADTICLQETDLLNCLQDLLRRIKICFASKKMLIC